MSAQRGGAVGNGSDRTPHTSATRAGTFAAAGWRRALAIVGPEAQALHDAGVLQRPAFPRLPGVSRAAAVDARGLQQTWRHPDRAVDGRRRAGVCHRGQVGPADLCAAYGLSLPQAQQWGLYVSRGRGPSPLGIEEPPLFVEPAVFLVRPDRTLYYACVQSMPFAPPCFAGMMRSIATAIARECPARGEVTE